MDVGSLPAGPANSFGSGMQAAEKKSANLQQMMVLCARLAVPQTKSIKRRSVVKGCIKIANSRRRIRRAYRNAFGSVDHSWNGDQLNQERKAQPTRVPNAVSRSERTCSATTTLKGLYTAEWHSESSSPDQPRRWRLLPLQSGSCPLSGSRSQKLPINDIV